MSNSKEFKLPGGSVAFGVVSIDPETGLPFGGGDSANRVKIIGRCSDVDNVLRDTWDGPTPLYVFPAAPMQMQIVSTAAGDTAAGAGVRTVRLYYLDANYVERQEVLTLNGVTPVLTTATNILRVNKMHAGSVGANGVASGAITLASVGGATTYSLMAAGRNFARQAIYTVPEGKILQIDQWQLSSGSTGEHFCQHTLVVSSDDGVLVPGLFLPKDEQGTQNGGLAINYPHIIERFPPRADVKVAAQSDGASANVIAMTAIFGTLYPST